MKLKDSLRNLVPDRVVEAKRSATRRLQRWRDLRDPRIQRNAALRNQHAGRRAFVLGNGPSLKDRNLENLADEITICCNAFWKHDIVEVWQPTYYALADPVFFDRSSESESFLDELASFCPSSRLIAPLEKADNLRRKGLEERFAPIYFVSTPELGKGGVDLTEEIVRVQNVVQLSLCTAIHLGCDPIYLLGVDHDWIKDWLEEDAYSHFYDGETIEDHRATNRKNELSKKSFLEVIDPLYKMFRSYEVIEREAREREIRIFNATEGSLLDIFDFSTIQ